jgi:DNA-binding HxlR family transcriptional regulator
MPEKKIEIDNELMKKCPINNTSEIISKKFTVLILRNIFYTGHKRFNEFLENIEGINHKTLALRLKEMVKEGLLVRRVFAASPLRTEYHATQKGRGLLPVLEQMAAYSLKYCSNEVLTDGKPRSYSETYGIRPRPLD